MPTSRTEQSTARDSRLTVTLCRRDWEIARQEGKRSGTSTGSVINRALESASAPVQSAPHDASEFVDQSLRLSDTAEQKLRYLAWSQQLPYADVITQSLSDYLERHRSDASAVQISPVIKS